MRKGNFYAQFETDKHIAEFFDEGYVGTCIEVGACDGIFVSNTLHFEQKGWTCICIEPNKAYYDQLVKNRKITARFACGETNEDNVDFSIFDLGGNQSAISSLVVDERLVSSHKHLIKNSFTEKVNIRTLDSICEQFEIISNIDFVSIDTEGTEIDVLKGFDLNKWKPKLLVIENNFEDPNITEYLKDFRYNKIKRIGVNDFYSISIVQ